MEGAGDVLDRHDPRVLLTRRAYDAGARAEPGTYGLAIRYEY